jgi:hypothetical protein
LNWEENQYNFIARPHKPVDCIQFGRMLRKARDTTVARTISYVQANWPIKKECLPLKKRDEEVKVTVEKHRSQSQEELADTYITPAKIEMCIHPLSIHCHITKVKLKSFHLITKVKLKSFHLILTIQNSDTANVRTMGHHQPEPFYTTNLLNLSVNEPSLFGV